MAMAQSPGTFTATGDMTTPRTRHTATLLADGTVLIVGGFNAGGILLSSAELYDPQTATFKATGDMATPRVGHTATLLPDGKVLIAGGVKGFRPSESPAASAELYDPATKTFTPTGDMGRFGHTATLLLSGRVLIVGGYAEGRATDPTRISAELYDPSTGTFTPTDSLTWPGDGASLPGGATLLASGKVLVSRNQWDQPPIQHEIYDPLTGTMEAKAFSFTRRTKVFADPQANRCYLPVQASVLISSLVHKFRPEFDHQLAEPHQNPESFPVPLISDFDERNHRFFYDGKFAFKNPDWTYSIPAAVEEPVPSWYRFDFRREIDGLKSTEFWKSEDRTAKTLFREGNLRVVLTLMKAGAVLKEHNADGNVSIHVLSGRIRVRLDQNTAEFEQGQMMILSPGVSHSVEALADPAFVICISAQVPTGQ
jgi:quercetin dioxygenase-like cupin family protein